MAALPPPPDAPQALVPVAQGWPLREVSGHAVWKLVPDRAQPLARALAVVPAVAFGGALLGILTLTHGSLWIVWVSLKGAKLGFLAVAGAGLARLSGRLVGWQMRRLATAHAGVASLRAEREGKLVRVVGTVRAPHPFSAAISGEPAVLAHYEVRGGSRPPRHQVRGIDFLLEIDASEPVLVSVRDAYLEGRADTVSVAPVDQEIVMPRAGDGVEYRESRLGPGDRVEALGVLTRTIDPTLSAGPERAPPLRLVIQAGPRLPLLLRKVRAREG